MKTVDDRTTELCPQTPLCLRQLRPKSRNKWELTCSAYRLRTTFPDNVVQLWSGDFFLVEVIQECTEFVFMLRGRKFMRKREVCDRSKDYFIISCPCSTTERLSTSRVRGKCYIVPYKDDVMLHKMAVEELDPMRIPSMEYCVSVMM